MDDNCNCETKLTYTTLCVFCYAKICARCCPKERIWPWCFKCKRKT